MKPFSHFFLTAILCCIFQLSYGQRPVLHLDMDKEQYLYVTDKSGKQNDARVMGDIRFVEDRFGNPCRATYFNGAGYLRVPHDKSLDLSFDFSVTAWVKIPANVYSQNLQWLTLVCKGEDPNENTLSPAFRAQLTNRTASVNYTSTKTIGRIQQAFPTDRWFHVAIIYDSYALKIFQDGRESARFALTDPIYPNSEPLNIGRDIPGATEYFLGAMDDLRLFDKALSVREVQKLYKDNSYQNLGSACPQDIHPSPAPTPTPIAISDPEDPYSFTGYAENNLTLLLDVSASMRHPEKLPLLKKAFLKMIPYMRHEDQVSIVSFSGGAKVVLDGVSATDTTRITKAIEKLVSSGGTKGKKGLKMAYKLAQKNFIDQGNNRIILASDANFEVDKLEPLVKRMSHEDIYFSVFSFGKLRPSRKESLDLLVGVGKGNHENIHQSNIEMALLNEAKNVQQ